MDKLIVVSAITLLLVFVFHLYSKVRNTSDSLDKAHHNLEEANHNLDEVKESDYHGVSDTDNASSTFSSYASYKTADKDIKYDSAGRDTTELSDKQYHLVVDFFHQYDVAKAKDKSKPVRLLLVNSVGETIYLTASNQKQVAILLNGIFGLNKGLSTYLNMLKKAKS